MSHPTRVAITGAGLVTSLGLNRDQTWQAVRAGRCGMGPMTAMEQPLPEGRDGGQAIDLPADYEPGLLREVRYLRFTIQQALDEAGITSDSVYPGNRRAILLGTTLHGMRAAGQFLRTGDFAHLRKFLAGSTLDMATEGMPFGGLAATTCSACSSSLGSIALAVTLLQSGQCDLAVAGGYDTISEYVYGGFNSLRLVSEGPLRPFSCQRSGMKLAEGYGIVVLERAPDAAKRGRKALAVIAGWGESADAHHLTQPHPQGNGASRAMKQAIDRAGLDLAEIDLVAAHATGTPDNDAAEHAALATLFGSRLGELPVVGFKSHLGHTLGGAGAVELILSMMAMRDQTVPPCANVTAQEVAFADMKLSVDSARPAKIRATLNTSLGFGGANTSIVLVSDSAPDVPAAPTPRRDVFITGVGAIMPGIFNDEAFLEHFKNAITPAWERSWPRIEDADLESLLNARRVRRMSDYVKLQLAAAQLACRNAQITDPPAFFETCAAILGTTHGSSGHCMSYYGQVVREGIAAANPMLFAEGVPNAGAAQLSLMLGIKGACQTIIGTRTAGLDALNLAATRIATGAWDRAIIGAGEEEGDILWQAYQQCGLAGGRSDPLPFVGQGGFVTGSGAVALVLESKDSVDGRQAKALARVSGWSAGRGTQKDVPRGMTAILRSLGPVDAIISSASSTWVDRAELAAIRQAEHAGVVWAPYGQAPELFSAGPLLGLAAVILSKRMPKLLSDWPSDQRARPATGSEQPQTVAAIATDFTGTICGTRAELL